MYLILNTSRNYPMSYITFNPIVSSCRYKNGRFLQQRTDSPLLLAHKRKDSSYLRWNLVIDIPSDYLDLSTMAVTSVQLELPIQAFYPYNHDFHNEITISSPYTSNASLNQVQTPLKLRQRISPTSFVNDKLYLNITPLIWHWNQKIFPTYQIRLSLRKPNLCLEILNQELLSPRLHIDYENTTYAPPSPEPPPPEPSSKPSILYLTSTHCDCQFIEPNAPLILDTVNPDLIHDITYTPETGYFSFNTPGYYYLQWIINLRGSSSVNAIAIGLLNQETNTALNFYSPCLLPSQVCGQHILHVTEVPVKYALINSSDGILQLAGITTQSSLAIFKL